MLKQQPENAEEYVHYFVYIGFLDEACLKLADIVNGDKFVSKKGKTNCLLLHDLCKLKPQNPDKVHFLDVKAIIKGSLRNLSKFGVHLQQGFQNSFFQIAPSNLFFICNLKIFSISFKITDICAKTFFLLFICNWRISSISSSPQIF